MRSSRLTTLFSSPPPEKDGIPVIMGSFLLHVMVIVLIYFGIKHLPHVYQTSIPTTKYETRIVQLRSSDEEIQWSSHSQGPRPDAHTIAKALSPGGSRALPSTPKLNAETPAPQTLIQPDLPSIRMAQKVPIPQVLMWTPEKVVLKQIVPPPTRENASANIRPSVSPPSHELIPSNFNISTTSFTSELPEVPPGATSPIAVHGTGPQLVPETTSTLLQPTTSASVVSISEVRVAEGNIVLPAINEAALSSDSSSTAPGPSISDSKSGSGNTADNGNGVGSGKDSGEIASAANSSKDKHGKQGAATGSTPALSTNVGSDSVQQPGVKHLSLPPNGQFGVVVVGASIADEYPETNGLWSDRLAYTVYLHLGTAKNWILQYSIPLNTTGTRSAQDTHPDAPWPYEILRPTLNEDDTDAVMVHGLVDTDGHFEHLTVLYPQAYQQSNLLLSCLRQWKFRPAMQNGHATEVEVLLIIPNQEQ